MINNYLDLPAQYSTMDKSLIVIIPVPYDGTSTWKKGAARAPQAIIKASAHVELYDIETDSQVYLQGIHTHKKPFNMDDTAQMVSSVEKTVLQYINRQKLPVILGGEHSVSIGGVRAFAQKYPDLSVLQLDAHADLRDKYMGSALNHACVMTRIRELCPAVQVGIRSMDITEKRYIQEGNIFLAREMQNGNDWIARVKNKLTENVYLTIDLDYFDPAVMPATGTPEPGGFFWYETLIFLKEVCMQKNIVGFDLVELCPNNNHATEFFAAKLVYKILSYIYHG